MTAARPKTKPSHVATGLRIFWIALVVSNVIGLYPELRYIYDQMEALKGENPFQADTLVGLALAVPFLLLTPKFVGITVAAAALVFIARGKAWSRWILLLAVLATGASLASSVRYVLIRDASVTGSWGLAIGFLLYLAMVAALILFYSPQSSTWFRAKERDPKRDAQHDVA